MAIKLLIDINTNILTANDTTVVLYFFLLLFRFLYAKIPPVPNILETQNGTFNFFEFNFISFEFLNKSIGLTLLAFFADDNADKYNGGINDGMDISQFDFTHAPEFFENMEPQEVRGELSKARDAANAISGRMAKVLEQDKNLNQRQQGRAENGQKESEAKTGEQKTQEHDRGMAR